MVTSTDLGNGVYLIYLVQPASACKLLLEGLCQAAGVAFAVVGKATIAKGNDCLIVVCSDVIA